MVSASKRSGNNLKEYILENALKSELGNQSGFSHGAYKAFSVLPVKSGQTISQPAIHSGHVNFSQSKFSDMNFILQSGKGVHKVPKNCSW